VDTVRRGYSSVLQLLHDTAVSLSLHSDTFSDDDDAEDDSGSESVFDGTLPTPVKRQSSR
jgi:hypothetical protein